MKYRIKRINTNYHKKVTKSVTKWSNPELLSMTYIFIVLLMWVSPLVHDAIQFHGLNGGQFFSNLADRCQ